MRPLEVGGGENPKYHPNMDIRALPTVDVVHDIRNTFPFPDASFDLVYMSHVLEHVSHWDVPKVLAEAYRVLRGNGKLTVKVPDMARLATGPKWFFNVEAMFGDQIDYLEWRTHKTGFWMEGLKTVLTEAKFREIMISETFYGAYPELTAEAIK